MKDLTVLAIAACASCAGKFAQKGGRLACALQPPISQCNVLVATQVVDPDDSDPYTQEWFLANAKKTDGVLLPKVRVSKPTTKADSDKKESEA